MRWKSSLGSLATSMVAGLRSLVLPCIAALCLAAPESADAAADLTVEVSAPAQAGPGGSFTYLVTAKNIGNSAASQLMMIFTVPAGVSILPPGVPTGYTGEFQGRTFYATSAGYPFAAGAEATFEVLVSGLTAPITVSPGAAVIDPGNLVVENLENNNSSAQTITTHPRHLLHRWSFSDITDSVGNAHLSLFGTASLSGGQLELPGSAQPRVNYASVPIGNTIANATDLTVEAWFTRDTLTNWSKVWMFGIPNAGTQPGLSYLAFTPRANIFPRQDFDLPTTVEWNTGLGTNPPALAASTEYHVVCVYNGSNNQMRLFINGVLADTSSMEGGTVSQMGITTENFFGAAVYWPDPDLDGRINEVRIWDRALTSAEIAASRTAGPNVLQFSAPSAPVITSSTSARNIYAGDTATFSVIAEANPAPTYQWYRGYTSNTSDPVPGATSATFTTPPLEADTIYWVAITNSAGTTMSMEYVAVVLPIPTSGPRHRWSFNDTSDSAGGATLTLMGNATLSGGQLELPGSTTARTHYAKVPIGGTIASLTSMTVETWFTLDQFTYWSKVWHFAQNNSLVQPSDAGASFLPRNGNNVPQLGFDSNVDVYRGTDFRPPFSPIYPGPQFHVASVFDVPNDEMRFYINGVLADAVSMGGSTVGQLGNTPLNYLGAEVFYPDADLDGRINEMRIWDRPLSAPEIARNISGGPNQLYLPPAITGHPSDTTAFFNGTATLTATATGAPSVTWQWYRGASGDTTNPVSGATSASFTTPALTATTSYWAKAITSTGTANTNAATVTVLPHAAGETHWTGAGDGVLWANAFNWTAGVPNNLTHAVVDTNSEVVVLASADMESFDLRSGTVRVADGDFMAWAMPALGSYIGGWDGSPATFILEAGAYGWFLDGLNFGGPDGGNMEMIVRAGAGAAFNDWMTSPYHSTGSGISPDADSEALEASRIVWTFEVDGPQTIAPLLFDQLYLTANNDTSIRLEILPVGQPLPVGRKVLLAEYSQRYGNFSTPDGASPILDDTEFVSHGYTYRLNYNDPSGIAATVTATPTSGSQFIVNGSFELPAIGGGLLSIYSPNSTTLQGWTVSQGDVELIRSDWSASDGLQSLDMSGMSAGSIHQDVTGLIAGGTYELSFDLAGNPVLPSEEIKRLQVMAGTKTKVFEFDVTGKSGGNMGWTRRTMSFVALAPTQAIRFTSVNNSDRGPALDNVTLRYIDPAVPEAPTITWQPSGQTIIEGSTATLTVEANGTPAPSFQWFLGESGDVTQPISGATSATFVTPALTTTTSYWVRASNASGAALSATAVVTVTPRPVIALSFETGDDVIPHNSLVNFGARPVGGVAASRTFYFWNLGATTLENLQANCSGTNAGDFSILNFGPATLAPGARGEVTLVFSPGGVGARTASLTVTTNNPADGHFVLNLAGAGVTPLDIAQQAFLKASNAGGSDYFGTSVAIDGNTVVVGAPYEDSSARGINGNQADDGAADAGAVYVFTRQNGSWQQQAYLKASNADAGDNFGMAVAISGDTLVVGAPYEGGTGTGIGGDPESNGASRSGAAYVFVRNGTTWTQQAYVKASNTEVNDYFGCSVAISGNTMLAGAYGEDSAATGLNGDQGNNNDTRSSGAAYIFVRSGTVWSQQAYVKPSNTGNSYYGENFGFSLAIDGDLAVIGALDEESDSTGVNGDQGPGGNSSGAAYAFHRTGTTWTQEAYLKATDYDDFDYFGVSVAVSGQTVVVGAEGYDEADENGAAYVFVRDNGNWTHQADLRSSNEEIDDRFGRSVSISGDIIVVGAPQEESAATGIDGDQDDNSIRDAGAAYVFVREAGNWIQRSYLKSSTVGIDDRLGESVAASNGTIVASAYGQGDIAYRSGAAYIFEIESPEAAPVITTHPLASQTIVPGATAALTVAATGNPAPTFQWYAGNSGDTANPISGATSASFTTPSLAATTSYWVRATNASGSTNSNTATVIVPTAPEMVIEGPSGAELSNNSTYSFGSRLIGATAAPKTFTVRNAGTAPLDGFTVSKVSGPVSGFTIDSSGSGGSIAPGGSQTFTIAFNPESEGLTSWAIRIDGGDGTIFELGLSGTGVSPGQLAQEARLKASPPGGGDEFGYASAVSGDTVVIGACLEDSNASGINGNANDNSLTDSGAAYVYTYTDGEWIQQAYLKASTPAANDWFGVAVAISGDTIVVGARQRNGATGAAYVFVRNGGVWTQQAYLTASNAEVGTIFGASLAISGDRIVVGSPYRGSSSASAYLFERSGTNWTETAILSPAVLGSTGGFGHAVGISGDVVVVGAPNTIGGIGQSTGTAHVFSKQGAVWTEEAVLTASPRGAGDHFGISVAASGDRIVIGALQEDSAATGVGGDPTNNAAGDSGAAYVFARGQGGWTQEAYLKAPNTGGGDFFGWSVAIAGDVIAVGAPSEDGGATGVGGPDNNNVNDAGAVYTFHRSGSTWVPWKYLKASDTSNGAYFGHSVGVSGDRVVAGARYVDSAYVFYGVAPVPSLRHRWSFNGNLADSVGGATAQIVDVGGSNATLDSNGVHLAGGTRTNSDYIELGGGLIPKDGSAFTLEFWATPLSVQYWSRIFNLGGNGFTEYITMTWTHGSNQAMNRTEWRDDIVNTSDVAFAYALGEEYHIVLSVEPGSGVNQSTLVTWYAAPASSASLGAPMGSFSTTNLVKLLTDTGMQLGRGPFPDDATANARYNEARIWNHTLSAAAREANHVSGPDNARAPEIVQHPQSQAIATGSTATLTVAAISYPSATYQWYEGTSGNTATPIPGATSASFTTPALTAAKSYWVRLTNTHGHTDSTTANVTVLSSNANLSSLTLSAGTLSPTFTASTTLYQATVASGVDSLTVTPVVADPGATVKVEGITTTSGAASQSVALQPGLNEIEVTVTAANLTTIKTYQVNVTRVLPMSVATGDPSAIGQSVATLAGTVLPNGTAQVRFQYGTTASYGLATNLASYSGTSTQPVQQTLSGLIPGQLYHYRILATNGVETIYGEDRTFTTIVPPPLVMTGQPFSVTTAGATFVGAVDARGLTAQVRFEYGLTNLYGQTAHATDIPVGGGVKDVFKEVTGLVANATYHCRLVATTTSGTTYGQDVTFVATAGTGTGNGIPTAAPEVVTGTVANVSTAAAELLGTVDSNGGTTFVSFEYGTTTAYGSTRATTFDVGNVDTAAAVSLSLGGLSPGTLYHYRLVATNSRGTSYGSDAVFTTAYLPPSVSTGGATALTTTSVRVFAAIVANGASSDAIIEYGVNPASLNLEIDTTPATITGYGYTQLQADLPNLSQGTTYFYRVKATNIYAATSIGELRSFDVGILSGLDRRFPDAIQGVDHNGSLTVNLTPSGIGSGWRFAGEPGWRSSGSRADGLASGDRLIEFRPVAGHIQPPTETIAIASGAGEMIIERGYTSSGATGSGTVEILLKPAAISATSVPVASRAQWRLAGEDDTMWRDSGTSATGLVPGLHVIECKPVDGRSTPVPATVVVGNGQTTIGTITYFIAPQQVGTPSGVLGFEAVSTDQDRPYAFAGQILSDAGAGTGFVVKPRVVATAGHVLFDDGTLAATTGVRWMFQRDAGIHEPVPQSPRGFYLMTGYAARRGLDNSPGVSSPQSQNLDAGAMYFRSDVSRHGFSGFLASDATVNEFVVSPLQKTLVGYPVEDVAVSNIGKMHATPVAPVAFASAFGQTYTTSAIRSGRGNSGGPLCVRNAAGTWYPAAIFLGGTAQTVVRAIDSDVSDLFGFAEASATAGAGETGGSGVVGPQQPFGTPIVGSIRVNIEPAAARAAGARWRINAGDPYQPSGNQLTGLSPNDYTVLLSTVPGFLPPTPQTVDVDGGFLSTLTFTYQEIISPPVVTSVASSSAVRGQPLTYQIQSSSTAQSFNLFGNLPSGVSFNALTGLVSGIPQEAGVFIVTVSVTNAGGSGTKQVTLSSRPIIAPQSLTAPWEQPLSYQVIGSETGEGVSWSASGLPQGLSIHPSTGVVSGTPVVAGVFPATITLTKNGASSSTTLTLTITGAAPVFTLQPPATRQIEFGTSTVFTVAASGTPSPTFQWFRGESGDTSQPVGSFATFTTPVLTQPARYWARATSISGGVNSTSVEVTLTPSTNPYLSAIEPSAGQLTPAFYPTSANYSVTVPNSVTAISFVPRVAISQTTVKVAGGSVVPGTGSQIIPLVVGPTQVTIESTAGDGLAKRTYQVTVHRLEPPVAVTGIATAITDSSATLNGTVDPNGSVTTYFQYRTTGADWEPTPSQTANGVDPVPVQIGVGNLAGSTPYEFRIVVVTPTGEVFGNAVSFTTAAEPPSVATGNPAGVQTDRATFTGAVNPNGLPLTALRFNYGTSAELLGTIINVPLPSPNGGTSVVDVTWLETGLVAQAGYHYRLEAVSAAGTTLGRTVSFTATTGPGGGDGLADSAPFPTATVEATGITTGSAVLHGTTFPNDGATLAWFEYGIVGESETKNTKPQDIGNGNEQANVTQFLDGLLPAIQYRYRLAAENAKGVRYGDYRTFTTVYNPPIAITGAAEKLTSTSVLVRGVVRALGSEATVHVEFGTDGVNFLQSSLISESGGVVNGDIDTPVSAVLAGLDPSTRYYARVRASRPTGTGYGQIISFLPGALMGQEVVLPPAVPAVDHQGQLTVTLVPSTIGGWRIEGETLWRVSGSTVTGLTTGDRIVEFQPVAGFNSPPPENVAIVSGAAGSMLEVSYYQAGAPSGASLTVNLLPSSITGAALPVASRAQWRLSGVPGDPWRDSGAVLPALESGSYLIEFKSVSGHQAPSPHNVVVADGESRSVTRTYFTATAPNLNPPIVIPHATVSAEEQLPYRHVGQLRSDAGSFTGFVVKRRVVATAGQAVFDEATLSVTSGIQWLHQRDQGVHEPDAQVPRGVYVFDGYAAQREAEANPGTLSPTSRNLNVAALYFNEDAGRGGFSGFISSDEASNPHLVSSKQKSLAGYPVAGISLANQGRMHATAPSTASYAFLTGRTFDSSSIRGPGGMEGGPLSVRVDGGAWFPAGIYVGGTTRGAVRAIDAPIIDLFSRAEVSGNGGGNSTGGGITHTSVATIGTATQPGAVKVIIEPKAARDAGAVWSLRTSTYWRDSEYKLGSLKAGTYTLTLTTVPGFQAPTDQTVQVTGGEVKTITFTYELQLTDAERWRQDYFGTTSNTGDAADAADPDGDGQINADEFTAGIHPKNSSDRFTVKSVTRSGTSWTVSFAGKAGRIYRLERRTSLDSGPWTSVHTTGPIATSGPLTLTDTSPPGDRAFYRVVVSPAGP